MGSKKPQPCPGPRNPAIPTSPPPPLPGESANSYFVRTGPAGWTFTPLEPDSSPTAFEKDTTYRLLVEAARHWVISNFMAKKSLPPLAVFYVYSTGPSACLDWGDSPGMSHPDIQRPMRRKRIKVTLEIEDH